MSHKLEQDYSWEEIANLFADKIEKDKFIEEKEWNRNKFLEWFRKREPVGLCFDWKLVARAYSISCSLEKQHDHFTVIVGTEGTGKSTLMIQFASWISPSLNISDITFNMPDYIKKLQLISTNYKKNKANKVAKSLLIDEGGINLFSRESLSHSNKLLAKTFMVQRFLNVHVGICIPHYWSLDTLIRSHRINTLIIIKRRGDYKVLVGRGIKAMNSVGGRDKDKPLAAIPIPYGFFWDGKFRKDFPKTISSKEYENHKFKHIRGFLQEARVESQIIKMVKVTQIEKDFGLHKDTIINQINSGEIEGRKIGNQWFITKRAYDQLIMMK